ncbi:MAG TPA: type II toxin-antitoxin system RelE/ParE family toxin [Humisphaera sp.]
MNVQIGAEAAREVEEAFTYYESDRPGRGWRFLTALEQAYRAIEDGPERWPLVAPTVRKTQVARFPYAVLYQVRETGAHVFAVMHQRRRPGYWKDRIGGST